MNADRRKRIVSLLELLEDVINEEQEAFDNMPESLQSSEKGENSQSAIDAMESARDYLQEAEGS